MSILPSTQTNNDTRQIPLEEMPITRHLVILRKHLFKIVGVLLDYSYVYCLLQAKLISFYQSLYALSYLKTLP